MQNQRPIAAYIVFESHPTLTDKIPLFEGENTVGRVPEKASVIIKDGQISSSHAKINITSNSIIIVDMGSKNGTFLDTEMRERIDKGKQYEISENQKLSFGQVYFQIERVPQTKKLNIQPKNAKELPSKKLNLLVQFDQLTEKESKKLKLNQKDQNDSSFDEKAVDKKTKKESQNAQKKKKDTAKIQQAESDSDIESSIDVPVKNSKEKDEKKTKLAKQKEQKEKKEKERKEKELKQKKSRQQKEKKQKEQQLKKEREQAQRKDRQQRQRKEKDQKKKKQKEEQEKKERQQKLKLEKQLKKKEEQQKKKKLENKKETGKNTQKNKNDESLLNPKNIKGRNSKSVSNEKKDKNAENSKQKSVDSRATSKDQSHSPQKQKKSMGKNGAKQKQSKESKKEKQTKVENNANKDKDGVKKQIKNTLQVQKRSRRKSESNSKEKSSKSQNSQEKNNLVKTKNRKRIPAENQNDDSEEVKGYRLRQRLLKVTKFKISGDPITFYTSPFLKLADDDEEDFDVLVMDSFIRTYKLLFAISKGIPVVKKSWLVDSECNKKVAEVEYHWLEYPGDKWLIRDSVRKVQEGDGVLKDMEFFIASIPDNLHIEFSKLERLIYNAGGSVIMFSANLKAKNVYVLIEKDFEQMEAKKAKSVNKENTYYVELVLEGIVSQKLDFKKHKVSF